MDFVPLHIGSNWNKVLIIGEHPSAKDKKAGMPFRGTYGLELQKLLSNVGISFKNCAMTYAYKDTVPQGDSKNLWGKTKTAVKNGEAVRFAHDNVLPKFVDASVALQHEVRRLKPTLIITLGEAALRALLEEKGIDDFRGSMEYFEDIPVMPTHTVSRIWKQPALRFLISNDMQRAGKYKDTGWPAPNWNIKINPTASETVQYLTDLLLQLDKEEVELGVDIETRRRFYIGTIGFATSETDAFVIPFIKWDWTPYWERESDELRIVLLIKQVLEHKNAKVAGQNYHYDAQYLARHWGIRSHIWIDTMVAHHTCFSAEIPKGLHVISSIYCEYHQYWKDESMGTDEDAWEPTAESWDNYLLYNGKDCCKTLDVARVIEKDVLPQMEMVEQWKFQRDMWPHLLKVMLRGNLYDWEQRRKQRAELESRMTALENFMYDMVPEELYPRRPKVAPFFKSPKQLVEFFYTVLNIPGVTKRNAKKINVLTTEDDALKIVMQREPLVKPLCEAILKYRSMRVFYDNFLTGVPDYDDYIRCSYKESGTSTYRLASSADCFDFGFNLQNVPKGDG